jgi:hypothetical protein
MNPRALDPAWHTNGDSVIAMVIGIVAIFYALLQVFFSWQSYLALKAMGRAATA